MAHQPKEDDEDDGTCCLPSNHNTLSLTASSTPSSTAPLAPQGDRRRLRALQGRETKASETKAPDKKRLQNAEPRRRGTRNADKTAADKEASGCYSPKRDTSHPSHFRSQRRLRKYTLRHHSLQEKVALLGKIIAAADKANDHIAATDKASDDRAAEEETNLQSSGELAFQDIPTNDPTTVPVSALLLGMLLYTTTNTTLQFLN